MADTPPLKIGIDCRLSGNAHAGIGRYIEELIVRLPFAERGIRWVFFFYSEQQAQELLNQYPHPPKNVQTVIVPIQHYSIEEQYKLPAIYAKEKLDILHVPHFNIPIFYQGKIIVTIHDLLWHEFRGLQVTTLKPYQYYFKYIAYRIITGLAIKKAKKILVPAETIKKVVNRYYPWAKDKIVVTKEGHSLTFATSALDKKTQFHKTLVYVGSLYPHKNIDVVLKALPSLPDYTLEIVGSRNIFQEQTRAKVKEYGVEKQVQFLGYIPDKALNEKLQHSFALLQPSLSEGFGLTGIEAMACGVPVIASNITIFKEIYQDGALFFDPYSPADFAKAVKNLEETDRAYLLKKGKKVAQQYSWDTMTQETLSAYLD